VSSKDTTDVPDRDPVDPALWSAVRDLFHRTLEQPSSERDTFLERATNDQRLRDEVRSLVSAHERAGGFIDPSTAPSAGGPLLPDRIGSYLIRGVLGEGGMGVVYLAEDPRLGRTVALKAVAPRFVGDEMRRERLRREARAAAALNHPGIATVYALEDIDNRLYIVGEYVPGETLRDELAGGPLSPLAAVQTTLAVARALSTAHERGVVHRDLKPENLIRTPSGDVKILDFGLARFQDPASGGPALTADGTVFGTPAYMSPEQIRGETVDGRADLFALGVVLYELVTGTHPFAGADPPATIARILEADPVRPREHLPPGLSATALGHLDRAILTCLRKRPNDRFPSARHLITALEDVEQALTGRGATPVASNATTDPGPTRARWWWQFHQLAATLGYTLLLVPLWLLRDVAAGLGTPIFIAALAGATAAGAIRLHLLFVLSLGRTAWRVEHPRAAPWKMAGDLVLVGALALAGVLALAARSRWGVLLVAAAAAVLVSAFVIEPATTRAAFDDDAPA
jgi:hypothetical protein